jgi:glycolate oxidase
MTDKKDEGEYTRAQGLVKSIFDITIAAGGSISGEHGIGLAKSPYLQMEINNRELQLMKDIKHLIDPKNMMNPGKIFSN